MKFCWHDWSVWGRLVKNYNGRKQQWRYCKKCNAVGFRTIREDHFTDIPSIERTLDRVTEVEG